MCVVSMIGDHYRDKWTNFPGAQQWGYHNGLGISFPTRQEFDALKRDVLEMKELLKRAKAYDERNGEKGCEMDEKMVLLKAVAKVVGVSLDDVLDNGTEQ